MASCSEAELLCAVQVLDDMASGCGRDFGVYEIFDAAFEEVRHTLLEVWARASPRECRALAPFLDLLTSLKLNRSHTVRTAVPTPGSLEPSEAIAGVAEAVFDLRFRSKWLLALVPNFGGARFSLQTILAARTGQLLL